MRVIIAGSRTIRDLRHVDEAMRQSGLAPTVVLSGHQHARDVDTGALHGADYFGEQWAEARGIPVELYPAAWSEEGLLAGPRRNQRMVDRADAFVAVWNGKSKGTLDIVRRARARGLRLFVYVALGDLKSTAQRFPYRHAHASPARPTPGAQVFSFREAAGHRAPHEDPSLPSGGAPDDAA
jgi:hypothetical protein